MKTHFLQNSTIVLAKEHQVTPAHRGKLLGVVSVLNGRSICPHANAEWQKLNEGHKTAYGNESEMNNIKMYNFYC